MKITIISDTHFFKDQTGLFLFHSVAREFNAVKLNIRCLVGVHQKVLNDSMEKINLDGDILVVSLEQKKRFISVFRDVLKIGREINKSDYIHVRGPSPAMLYTLILSFFYKNKFFWFKYANAWNESHRSFFWDIQKKLILLNKRIKVTVNGSWDGLPNHIIPFENPCIYEKDLLRSNVENKVWTIKKKVVFVGRITKDKGVFRILEAVNDNTIDFISEVIFIGSGKELPLLLHKIENHTYKSVFKVVGLLSKKRVFEIMEDAHLLLLPTTSPEGFPKVISEAWLKHCIPVTSDVSSIPQYVIEGKTGILWSQGIESWESAFFRALTLNESNYNKFKYEIDLMLPKFTYEYFVNRVKTEILNFE